MSRISSAAARTELLKVLPLELVDKILDIVYYYDFRFSIWQINARKYKKSIWYNPSKDLLKLCSGLRGGIQTGLVMSELGSPSVAQLKYIEPWFLYRTYHHFRDHQRFTYHEEFFMETDTEEYLMEETWKRWTVCEHGCSICEHRFPCMNVVFNTYPSVPCHLTNVISEIATAWDGRYYGKGGGNYNM